MPICVGRHMEGSFEYLGEVGVVVEAGGQGDLLDGIVGSEQEQGGFFQADMQQDLDGRLLVSVFHEAYDIGWMKGKTLGQLL